MDLPFMGLALPYWCSLPTVSPGLNARKKEYKSLPLYFYNCPNTPRLRVCRIAQSRPRVRSLVFEAVYYDLCRTASSCA